MEDKENEDELKCIECSPQCGFMVIGRNEEELADIVILHAERSHGLNMSREDIVSSN